MAGKVTITTCCGCTVSFEFAPEEEPEKAGEPEAPDDEPYDW